MEMLFFLGTFIISDSIWSVFAFFGVMDLPNLIRDGRMDHCLTKPVSSQFFATFRSPSIMASLSIPLGVVLIAIAVGSGQCDVPACGWLGWAVLVVAGAAVSYSCGVIVMSLAFIMLSVNAVWMLYSEIVDVQRYPIGIFPRPLRMVFTITLPVLLVANVPAHFALGKMGLAEAGWLIGVSAVLVFISTRFWKYGLKRYQSASS
jgi:ABC-2 type transport system permease protein